MILLNDVLPGRSVAGHTATDKGIDGLDVVQSALPRGGDSWPKSYSLLVIYTGSWARSSTETEPVLGV